MELLRPRLATEVEQAVAAGFNCFLSGFAEGADLLFAEIVARMKRDNPKLRLEAAIPYRGRYARLMEQPGPVPCCTPATASPSCARPSPPMCSWPATAIWWSARNG